MDREAVEEIVKLHGIKDPLDKAFLGILIFQVVAFQAEFGLSNEKLKNMLSILVQCIGMYEPDVH